MCLLGVIPRVPPWSRLLYGSCKKPYTTAPSKEISRNIHPEGVYHPGVEVTQRGLCGGEKSHLCVVYKGIPPMAAQDVKSIVAAADACGLADNKASLVAFTLVSAIVFFSVAHSRLLLL